MVRRNMTQEAAEGVLFPQEDPEEWAKQYSLTIDSRPCENCGKILTPSIPFATGRWRGLISKSHGCDQGYNMFIATKATQAERQELIDYFYMVSGSLELENDKFP